MDLPIIETKRLQLRPAKESDLESLYEVYSNPDVVRYTGDTPWTDKEEAIEFIEDANEGLKQESLFGWCIEHKQTKRVIGTCSLFECDLDKRVAEVSYEILPSYWGQGLATELLPLLIDFGFNKLELNRINAFVASGNIASLKLLGNNMFQREGLMRESWIDINGNPVNEHVLGLLHSDWLSCKEAL